MNRYIGHIIDDLRRSTENEEHSDLIGIRDVDFLRFLNDGQSRIQALIIAKHPKVYIARKDYNVLSDQETVDLPYDTYLNNKISNVKFKYTTGAKDYWNRLEPTYLSEIEYDGTGYPCQYLRQTGKIHLYPRPLNSGVLRVNYVRALPRLDVRRGQVSAVSITGTTIDSLSLDVATDNPDFDELAKNTRFCLVDVEGNIKAANVRIDSFDTTTGAATINAAHVLEAGETISVGDYIVGGQFTTTHSQVDESIERYQMSYASIKIMQQEGSNELADEQNTLLALEQEIIDSYSDISDDFHEIPVIISEDDDWDW